MMRAAHVCGVAIATLSSMIALGCVGGPVEPVKPEPPDHWVRDFRMPVVRGEIGKPFATDVQYDTNYLRDPEWQVTGLPPGLSFDPDKRRISGTPSRAGFFTVNVAVRKQVIRDERHHSQPDERWWPATFEIEIHAPPE